MYEKKLLMKELENGKQWLVVSVFTNEGRPVFFGRLDDFLDKLGMPDNKG